MVPESGQDNADKDRAGHHFPISPKADSVCHWLCQCRARRGHWQSQWHTEIKAGGSSQPVPERMCSRTGGTRSVRDGIPTRSVGTSLSASACPKSRTIWRALTPCFLSNPIPDARAARFSQTKPPHSGEAWQDLPIARLVDRLQTHSRIASTKRTQFRMLARHVFPKRSYRILEKPGKICRSPGSSIDSRPIPAAPRRNELS